MARSAKRRDRGHGEGARSFKEKGTYVLVGIAVLGVLVMVYAAGALLTATEQEIRSDADGMAAAMAAGLLGAGLALVALAVAVVRWRGLIKEHVQATEAHGHHHIHAAPERRMAAVEERPQVTKQPTTAPRKRGSPFGDIHPVVDVQGIGETYAKRLEGMDITDTEELWQANPDQVANTLDVPVKTVRSWQAMAELMALDGLGPQYAELLVRAGVSSIAELRNQRPEPLVKELTETEAGREYRIQGNTISSKHTREWIATAKEHDPKASRTRRSVTRTG